MTMTLTLAWWHAPAIITVLTLAWALFWPSADGGWTGGVESLFCVMIALFVSLLSWAIAGAFK
jgi:hypothetical protein